MVNKLVFALIAFAMTMAAAADTDFTALTRLVPGQRVEVHHQGLIDRGLFSLSNAYELIITTEKTRFLSIPAAEVDRVIRLGTESPNLGYFANAHDQLFPKPELVYERAGAPPAPVKEKKRLWWKKRG